MIDDMSDYLLATKYRLPPARPRGRVVPRPRLMEQLDQGLTGCLILISAPAGYGKTTLLSAWAAGCGHPVAWLTLDEGDNDPVRFWRYVDAALQTVDNRLGKSLRPALFSTQPPALERVITGLVNDIAGFGMELILVLEDYHVINNAEVHAGINFLLDNLPPEMPLIITTRSDPPLHLALRRGRAEMSEIRAADLRFAPDETVVFINQTMQLGLTGEDITALGRRAEGWIAGLQMAALSLEDETDRHAFVVAFSGDDRHIADYLIEEVLQRQPLDFQRFLLETSILDRLSAPLCDAVTGHQDSRAMLNALERANLFILPLDSRRESFRYHHLFGELLRRRFLQTESEATIKTLQRRAVDWLNANGHFDLAVEYALNFADFELATHLMVAAGGQFFTGNLLNTFLNLAARLPDEQIARNLTLACMLAWAAHATGHPQRAEHYIHLVEHQTGKTIDEFIGYPDDPSLTPQIKAALIELGAARARIDVDHFEITRAFHLVENLLPYLVPERDSEPCTFNKPSNLRGPTIFILGLAQKLHGDITLAAQTFMDSVAEGRRTSNFHIIALSLGHLGETQALQGRLHDAQRTFSEALDAPLETLQTSSFFGIARIGLGNLAYEWNDLEGAIAYLQAGIEQGKLWSSWECLLPGYTGLARLHAARQDWKSAFNALNELQTNTRENQGIIQASAESFRALLNFWNGNLAVASRWAEDFEPDRPRDYVLAWEYDALVRCRIWIAQGEAEKAGKLLNHIIRDAHQGGRNRRWLEAMCLRSLLFGATCRPGEALTTLQSVLEVAEPEDYVRLFVDEGEPMHKLLSRALTSLRDKEHLAVYVSRLLSAFEPANRKAGQAASLVEPLTEREMEVLKYIAEGLSNPEIANRLYLSPNTLKAHAQNIFTKLNVHNRVQAVNKAKELGLIE